jgi:hypothetical protein
MGVLSKGYVRNDSLDAVSNTAVTKEWRRKEKNTSLRRGPLSGCGGARECAPRDSAVRYSGFAITAQAIRGGAVLEAPEATA